MVLSYKTNGRALSIDLYIKANNKELVLIAFDWDKDNVKYLDRVMLVKANDPTPYTLKLPTSPKHFGIYIFDRYNHNIDDFKIELIEINDLKTEPLVINKLTKEFIDFASVFSHKMFNLKPDSYYSKNKTFNIRLFDEIKDNGTEINTPFRIHVRDNYIEASKNRTKNSTVARNMFLLLHEFSHNYKNINEWPRAFRIREV